MGLLKRVISTRLLKRVAQSGGIQVDVRHNIRQVQKSLTGIQRKQVPYAAQLAINQTLKDIQAAEQAQMPRKLDNPRPQTVKALRVLKWAKKSSLSGRVGFLDWANEFMQYQVYGGIENIAKLNPVPTQYKRLNRFGNIPGKRQGVVKGKEFIATTRTGTTAVWRATKKGKLTPMVWLSPKDPLYRKRFPFFEIAEGVTRSKFDRNFIVALQQALRTAR